MEKQYEQAFGFLDELSQKLLSGNKDRVVIVPGNHDIFWPSSKASMNHLVEVEDYAKQYERINKVDSEIRWSWSDISFYGIKDENEYQSRMKYFKKFYDRWYGDRKYSLDPSFQFEIFDYPDLNTSIIGLNSCYNNDHLRKTGALSANCLANMNKDLRNW